MEYRYKKNQIFKKKLNVPKNILNKIYNNNLTFQEFIEYDLVDKIPLSCLDIIAQKIIEKIGIEKAKILDWQIIYDFRVSALILEHLDEMNFDKEDINEDLYELGAECMDTSRFTEGMRNRFADKFVFEDELPSSIAYEFNHHYISLNHLIEYWDVFKNKDLDTCLKNIDSRLTDRSFKQFMQQYIALSDIYIEREILIDLIINLGGDNLSEVEKKAYISNFAKEYIERNLKYGNLTNKEYQAIFTYVDLKEYLLTLYDEYYINKLFNNVTQDEILASIPISLLFDRNVVVFICEYGFHNIMEFDKECGHFFSTNNYEMLKLMYDMYLHYSGNEHNPERTIHTINNYDENGNYIDRQTYTKEEFYEAIRRMIVYGPSDWNYIDKASDYRIINGPFRDEHPELFVSDDLPEEFKSLFYTKKLNPKAIKKFKNLISHLKDKDLESCFKSIFVEIRDDKNNYNYQNVYNYLIEHFGFDETMTLIIDYADVFEEIFNSNDMKIISFNLNDSIDIIIAKINDKLAEAIIKNKILLSSDFPEKFKEQYPRFFLPDDTPLEIKEKFYNRKFTLEEFINNPDLMKYFEQTDIALGLDESYSNLIDIFQSNDLIVFLQLCGETVKNDEELLTYFRESKTDLLTIKTASELLYRYFKENNDSLKYLPILDKLGFDNNEIKELISSFNELLKIRPELDVNNPSLSGKLISKKVIEEYGYDIISAILEYNTGAQKVLIEASENNDILLKKWLDYIKQFPNYNKKLVHFALLSYDKSQSLIYSLVSENVALDEFQIKNLMEILAQRNKYNVKSINELSNYQQYRRNVLHDKLEANNIIEVKESILEILFNTSLEETKKIFKDYGLYSKINIKYELVAKELITAEDEAIIEIIREILTVDDINKLRSRFDEIVAKGNIRTSLIEIEQKLHKYYGREFQKSLFKDQEHPEISRKYIDGIDEDLLDINGKVLTSQTKIEIVELDDVNFKLLIHKLHDYDPKFKSLANIIKKDPGMWNKLEGASTLSTSMISDQHMRCVGGGSGQAVYLGFNDISENALMLMGRRDIFVEHGGRKLEPISSINEYMDPDVLQIVSYGYNEVALDRKGGTNSKYDYRIQPSCIICFDGIINNDSKRAAQYFNIPIYMIDRNKYYKRNKERYEQYKNKNITFYSIEDVHNILYSKNNVIESYELAITLADYSLSKNIIDKNNYQNILIEIRNIVAKYANHNNVRDIDLTEIEKRLSKVENINMSREDEKTWTM